MLTCWLLDPLVFIPEDRPSSDPPGPSCLPLGPLDFPGLSLSGGELANCHALPFGLGLGLGLGLGASPLAPSAAAAALAAFFFSRFLALLRWVFDKVVASVSDPPSSLAAGMAGPLFLCPPNLHASP